MNPYKMWGHVSFWSGVGLAGLGGVFTGLAAGAAGDYKAGNSPAGSRDALDRDNGLAVACYVVGGALLATGVSLWILSPGDDDWSNGHAMTLTPAVTPSGGYLVLAGQW